MEKTKERREFSVEDLNFLVRLLKATMGGERLNFGAEEVPDLNLLLDKIEEMRKSR